MHINRQRQLPHEDWKDPRLVVLPPAVRHLATGLRMMADPEGRGPLNLHLIRSNVFPSPDVTGWWPELDEIETYMLLLDDAKWLTLYSSPETPTGELFQILARWPHVSREGESRLPPPAQRPSESLSGRFPGSGERASAGASAGESVNAGEPARAGERAGLSGSPNQPLPALPPSPFCSVHVGGAPEQTDCRDCGTARLRHQRYGELRAARGRAASSDDVLAAMALPAIDAEMRQLEQAAARAILGNSPQDQDGPTEFIDDDGRIETT